jgi:hypothetical protein
MKHNRGMREERRNIEYSTRNFEYRREGFLIDYLLKYIVIGWWF